MLPAAGAAPPPPHAMPPCIGHGRTLGGSRRASAPSLAAPSIFPGSTASRAVSLQWVWMGGERARREWLRFQQKMGAWEEGKVFCFGPQESA